MLSHPHRLRDRQAFDLIYKRGRRKSGSLMTVGWLDRLPTFSGTSFSTIRQSQLGDLAPPASRDIRRDIRRDMKTVADAGIPTQIAVVVSRKVSRKAVERNRVKRRIRAAVALFLPQIQPHQWIAIYARSTMLTCSWEQLRQELSGLLRKAGLLNSDPD
ncbi:MAG: ribonuclease P protein component [Synechococcaceae cyanobacterium SM2_3_2]|nr:ribonuclease P protein component [Synechococcaceae cyanobacterium SM2_3_2]